MLADRNEIARASEHAAIDAEWLPSILSSTQGWIERLCTENETSSPLAELVERVALSRDGIQVALKLPLLVTDDRNIVKPKYLGLTRFVPMQMKRRGVEAAISASRR
jgi:hypothetical protein